MVADMRSLLSSKDLSDVPPAFRIGSPADASDRKVMKAARRGLLAPATNYGVVFRVAFSARIEEREFTPNFTGAPLDGMRTGLAMRFCNVATGDPEVFRSRRGAFGSGEPGWVMMTDASLLWHLCSDGLSVQSSGREIRLAEVEHVAVQGGFINSGAGLVPVLTVGITAPVDGTRTTAAVMLGRSLTGADDNTAWLDALAERIPSPT